MDGTATWSRTAGDRVVSRDEPTGWVGWLLYAGVMLVVLGACQLMVGLVALFGHGYFVSHRTGQPVVWSYTTWGWVHLGLAATALGTGIGIMLGQLWARVLGVVLCVVNVVAAFAFLGGYPWFAVLLIAFSVITGYALIVHGRELADVFDV
jgi:hypothetical protein